MKNNNNISVVIPVFNEVESLQPLMKRLIPVLDTLGSYEVIFINDGSTDGSDALLNNVSEKYSNVKIIHLRKNFGKSLALQTGFQHTSGQYIIMMDADLQDQPEEIPNILSHLIESNLDVVTGWKGERDDPLNKRFFSRIFNQVVSRFSGLDVHDFNCGLKIMRRKCLEGLTLYGQLHRFMLVLLACQGFKVGELKVKHSARLYGHSKYGSKRIYEGLMDFMTIFFITRFLQTPLYFFGYYGLFCFILSLIIGSYFVSQHFLSFLIDAPRLHLSEHPLWILSPVLFIAGLICIFFGLLGELNLYLKSAKVHLSIVKSRTGFDEEIRDTSEISSGSDSSQ